MRKALLATLVAIAALFVTPVFAANLPLKAPPAPVVAATTYDWSGFYGGIGAGWAKEHFDWQYTNPVPVTCCSPFSASVDGTILSTILGAQVQFSYFVIGVEGTLSNLINNDRFASAGFPSCVGFNVPAAVCEAQLGRTSTVGGRGGLAWQQWLVYGEGGWAHTTVETRLALITNTTNPFDDTSATQNGTYWGAGIDYMAGVIPHFAFIIGVEYQHIDFGTATHLSPLDAFNVCPPGVNCRNITAKEDIVRVRLTGKWNPFEYAAPAPVTTRY
jgi:outer membrane immunogenic protein